MSNDPYINCLLDASRKEVRLITSVTLGPDDIIDLSVITRPLSTAHDEKYTALSYTWGSTTPKYPVRLNGAPLQVRENIHRFFRHVIRHEVAIWPIWVDSICINQNDVGEKNHQVAMMGYIYALSDQVIVWLGKASEGPLSSIVLGAWVAQEQGYSQIRSKPTILARLVSWLWGYSGATWFRPPIYPPGGEPWLFRIDNFDPRRVLVRVYRKLFVCAFEAIRNNEYWQRMWVVQELTLARKAYLFVDQDLFSIPQSMNVVNIVERGNRSPSRCQQFFRDLAFTLPNKYGEFDLSMWDLPKIWSLSMKCQDARDKIYGVLALTPWKDSFPIDYYEPIAELFARVLLRLQSDGPRQTEDEGSIIKTADRVIYVGFILSLSLEVTAKNVVDTLIESLRPCPALRSCTLPIIVLVELITFQNHPQDTEYEANARKIHNEGLYSDTICRPEDLDCSVIQAFRQFRGFLLTFDCRIDVHAGLMDVRAQFSAIMTSSTDGKALNVVCTAASKAVGYFAKIDDNFPQLTRRPPSGLDASARLDFEVQPDVGENHTIELTMAPGLLAFIVNDAD